MNLPTLKSVVVNRRSGCTLVRRFRGKALNMTEHDGRIIVVLESGKVYRSNKNLTRWYRIKP